MNPTEHIIPVNISLASGVSDAVADFGEIEILGLENDFAGTILRSKDLIDL